MKLFNYLTYGITASFSGSFIYIVLDDWYNKNVNNINKYPRDLENWKLGYFINNGFYLGGLFGILLQCPYKFSNLFMSLNSKPKIE